jgi:hypothetical protein
MSLRVLPSHVLPLFTSYLEGAEEEGRDSLGEDPTRGDFALSR